MPLGPTVTRLGFICPNVTRSFGLYLKVTAGVVVNSAINTAEEGQRFTWGCMYCTYTVTAPDRHARDQFLFQVVVSRKG